MKGIKLLLILCICVFMILGCNKRTGRLDLPDKIIIYNEGKNTVINKDNDKYENIINLINNRFNSKVSTAKEYVDDELIKKRKNEVLSVEFIYYQQQEFDVIGNGAKQFTYTRLLFPLEVKDAKEGEEALMYYGDGRKYSNGPVSKLSPSEDLVNLLWELK